MEIDFKTIRALSSSTRVKILNSLLEKRTTPTQLSKKTGKSKSTVSSHLSKLRKAGLIEKESKEGRKRVLYSPTPKAEAIVTGKERKIKFSLASSGLTAFTGIAVGFYSLTQFSFLSGAQDQQMEASMHAADTGTRMAVETAESSSLLFSAESLFFLGIGFLMVSGLTLIYGLLMKMLGE